MLALSHSTPTPRGGPCWHCSRFETMLYAGSAALCSLSNGPRVRAQPARGCASFVREPGTDDEPGPPPGDRARTSSIGLQVARLRKLPRQVDRSELETFALNTLGLNTIGGTLPSDSCGRNSL